jgi:hypothetical protein
MKPSAHTRRPASGCRGEAIEVPYRFHSPLQQPRLKNDRGQREVAGFELQYTSLPSMVKPESGRSAFQVALPRINIGDGLCVFYV